MINRFTFIIYNVLLKNAEGNLNNSFLSPPIFKEKFILILEEINSEFVVVCYFFFSCFDCLNSISLPFV